ncbi:MAG: hypothetical protein ACE5PT_13915 [Gemmatimonadales bacterium]
MVERRRSIAVILSAGGATLDLRALGDVPVGTVVRAEFARGERAACATATFEHECDPAELLRALRPWAHGRGWSVTVAPLQRPS